MNVSDERGCAGNWLSSLSPGNVFASDADDLYMLTNGTPKTEGNLVVVGLECGSIHEFHNQSHVIQVDAEVTITNAC